MNTVEQLTSSFSPATYELKLIPNFSNLTFRGEVKITGKRLRAGRSLKLHAKDMKIDSVRVNGELAKFRQEFRNDHLVITPKRFIKDVEIDIKYRGKVSDTMRGLYRSYFIQRGKRQLLLATQLEATHAREVFPSIDEPAAKAVFKLSLVYPKTYLMHSPNIEKIQVLKRGKVRRNYLSYLRARQGKATRLQDIGFDKDKVNVKDEPKVEKVQKKEADKAPTEPVSKTETKTEVEATAKIEAKDSPEPAKEDKAAEKKAKAEAFRQAQEAKQK